MQALYSLGLCTHRRSQDDLPETARGISLSPEPSPIQSSMTGRGNHRRDLADSSIAL